MHAVILRRLFRVLPRLGVLVLCGLGAGAFAQQADPPGRVAFVSQREGSVVFAPQGAEDWQDLPANRPLAQGDRMWTDPGARAELQLGTATLHVDGETHLGVDILEESAARFMLQQGTVNARVREVQAGENLEVDTPNVALRALQPGDYRIDVDLRSQQTRVIVRSGLAAVFGEGGQSVSMGAGRQATFAGRALAEAAASYVGQDDFDRWAEGRNREQDQALATRYVPRGVVGATQLDAYGTWGEDTDYGAVWYPTVTLVNWAPYRYGHWAWIPPWGWTWIDDAPWGFAPFHYGRWTMIGHRWAWVPGRLAPRPVYAPALVVFLGGGRGAFSIGTGPAVGWYPLAPGEAWWPWYQASAHYVTSANFAINLGAFPRGATNHYWRLHPVAVTAVREDDFRRGLPVDRSWRPVPPSTIDHARVGAVPARPPGRPVASPAPHPHGALPPGRPSVSPVGGPGVPLPPAVRDQIRAQQEQDRLQRRAERDAREQMREQVDPRAQHEAEVKRQRNAGKVDYGGSPRDAGKVDYGGSPRDAGKVDYGGSPRDAGKVDYGNPARDAGRVQVDPGGNFDAGRRSGPR